MSLTRPMPAQSPTPVISTSHSSAPELKRLLPKLSLAWMVKEHSCRAVQADKPSPAAVDVAAATSPGYTLKGYLFPRPRPVAENREGTAARGKQTQRRAEARHAADKGSRARNDVRAAGDVALVEEVRRGHDGFSLHAGAPPSQCHGGVSHPFDVLHPQLHQLVR